MLLLMVGGDRVGAVGVATPIGEQAAWDFP